MDRLFEATFYFSIGLLAIIITVYVLAVTLLGQAIKISINETKAAEDKKKAQSVKAIEDLNLKLLQAKQKAFGQEQINAITKELKGFQKQQRQINRKLDWIKLKPKLLTAVGGVLLPSIAFALAIGISAFGRYELLEKQEKDWGAFYVIIFLLIAGIMFLAAILKAIEEVAVVSEETALARQKEMQIAAMHEYQESVKPVLAIEWWEGSKPPFNLKPETATNIKIGVNLIKGDCAENTFMQIYLPPGFGFPEIEPFSQPLDEPLIGGFITYRVEYSTVFFGITHVQQVAIITPPNSGKYLGYLEIHSKGFLGERVPFEIKIE